jgi:hypothetical protein
VAERADVQDPAVRAARRSSLRSALQALRRTRRP